MSENFDRIEKYLFGQMAAEERTAFEKEMAGNPALQDEVRTQRAEQRSMHLQLKDDLRENLQSWNVEKTALTESQSTAKVVSMRRRRFLYAAAAAVALLIGVFVVDWGGPSQGALADNYFEETSPTVRGAGGDEPANLGAALEKMLEKDYAGALEQLSEVQDTDYVSITLLLKGECHYRLGEYAQASEIFEQAINSATTAANRQKAEWYLLLTMLKSDGPKSKANALLSKILGEPNHAFYPEATAIKSELD